MVLAASPAPVRQVNVEPVAVLTVGAVSLSLGVWQLIDAEDQYQQLLAIQGRGFTSTTQARVDLAAAVVSRERGKLSSALGASLVAFGSAFLSGALLWLFLEGFETMPAIAVTVAPSGGLLTLQGRF
jgi:uncharacterized membrane protein YgdD (TMEM256/DUF423 family)